MKLHALGEGAANQRRRDDGEHQLIDHEGLLRDGGRVVRVRSGAYSAQEGVLESSEEAIARPEAQAVPDDRPQHCDDCHHGETLHHGGQNILLAHQSAIEQRQAGAGHQQDQRCAGQHPGVISGTLGIGDLLL